MVYKFKIDFVHWCVLNTGARMGFRIKDFDKMVQSFHEVVSWIHLTSLVACTFCRIIDDSSMKKSVYNNKSMEYVHMNYNHDDEFENLYVGLGVDGT